MWTTSSDVSSNWLATVRMCPSGLMVIPVPKLLSRENPPAPKSFTSFLLVFSASSLNGSWAAARPAPSAIAATVAAQIKEPIRVVMVSDFGVRGLRLLPEGVLVDGQDRVALVAVADIDPVREF